MAVDPRQTPQALKTLLRYAQLWLLRLLNKADAAYVQALVRSLNARIQALSLEDCSSLERWRGSGATTRIFPTLDDFEDRRPIPSYLENDVVTFDLSRCYRKRFETMGADSGMMAPLRELFADPCEWLRSKANLFLKGATRKSFLETLAAWFTEELRAIREKKFYAHFYGLCTPKKARRGDRSSGVIHDIGLAVRLQNTLYVVSKELEFRMGSPPNTVLMIQTDSITLRLSGIRRHPECGELALMRGSGQASYVERLRDFMCVEGVAEWKIEALPSKAIFRGLAGKYAYEFVDCKPMEEEEDSDWLSVTVRYKTCPKNMLSGELANSSELSQEEAKRYLSLAFEKGPEGFGSIVSQLPEKITRVNKKGMTYRIRPELRALLASFVKTSSSPADSSAGATSSAQKSRMGPLNAALGKAKALMNSTANYHYVVALETTSGKRLYKCVTEQSRHSECMGKRCHEVFMGFHRAFIDYDDEAKELDEAAVEAGRASLCRFFRQHHGVEVEVSVYRLQRESPLQTTASFKRHLVFHAVDALTGKECVFADPKDIPGALGPTLMAVVDEQPYAWKKTLRLPGSPGQGNKQPYLPVDGSSLADTEVYANHCVCVSGQNTIVHGTHPRTVTAGANGELLFASEKMIADLLFDAVRVLCPDHEVKVGSSALDSGDPEARTLWQRVMVKCVANKNRGKLLDMTHFSEKVFVPLIVNGKPKAVAVNLNHKDNNNSWLNFVFGGSPVAPGYFSRVQFRVKGTQRARMWQMLECELSGFHLRKIATAALSSQTAVSGWMDKQNNAVSVEKSERYTIMTMDSAGMRTRKEVTAFEVRNSVRRRLRARRVRQKIRTFHTKRKRDPNDKKWQEDKIKYWKKSIGKIDSAVDTGNVLGFLTTCCSGTLASKVLEIEMDHVSAVQPPWESEFHTFADVMSTSIAAKEDMGLLNDQHARSPLVQIIEKWVHNVY